LQVSKVIIPWDRDPAENRLKTDQPELEERLLVEAAQRDPSRFAELYEGNFERVYGFIARRVRDRAEAEDLTSEVFHQALANLGRFEWRGVPFAAWLLRIAANALFDRRKRAAREPIGLASNEEPAAVSQNDWVEAERRALLFRLVGVGSSPPTVQPDMRRRACAP
jgi:RNA polymerase sigma-70 factor (ECF subfamily)